MTLHDSLYIFIGTSAIMGSRCAGNRVITSRHSLLRELARYVDRHDTCGDDTRLYLSQRIERRRAILEGDTRASTA